jgi:hypothetical protein
VKYFILCGLLPEVGPAGHRISFGGHIPSGRSDWPATGPLPQEGERLVVRCSSLGRMSVFVHDVFSAHFLVVARSQENAYRIAAPFRAFATVYLGWAMEEAEIEYLVELSRKPDPEDSTESMALSHVGSGGYEPDDALVAQHLETGWVLATEQIAAASSFLDSVLQSDRHVLALRYLERSHYLLSGFMSSSYYHFHYSRDRVSQTPYWRRKMYLERSSVYDLSFLSAFRALEALLGCGARSLEGRQILPGLLRPRSGNRFITSSQPGVDSGHMVNLFSSSLTRATLLRPTQTRVRLSHCTRIRCSSSSDWLHQCCVRQRCLKAAVTNHVGLSGEVGALNPSTRLRRAGAHSAGGGPLPPPPSPRYRFRARLPRLSAGPSARAVRSSDQPHHGGVPE